MFTINLSMEFGNGNNTVTWEIFAMISNSCFSQVSLLCKIKLHEITFLNGTTEGKVSIRKHKKHENYFWATHEKR
jgi:hypothetical protein